MVNLKIRTPEQRFRRNIFEWPNFDQFDKDFISPMSVWLKSNLDAEGTYNWAPRVDIMENEETWVFKAELPGMNIEDVSVTIEEGVLSIKGERKFEEEVKDGNFTRFERQYGSFERRFSMPSGINAEAVKGDYKNGVLTVTIPKMEEVKPKAIKIEVQ